MKKIEFGPGWEERARIRAYKRKSGGRAADLQRQEETATGVPAACGVPDGRRTGIGRLISGWTEKVAKHRE